MNILEQNGLTEKKFQNLIKRSFKSFQGDLIADLILTLNNKRFSQVFVKTYIGEFDRIRPQYVFIEHYHDEYRTDYVLRPSKKKIPLRKICIEFDHHFMYMFDNDIFRSTSSIENYCEEHNKTYGSKITPFSVLAETINHEWFYRSILWHGKTIKEMGQFCGYPEKKWGRAFFTRHCDAVLEKEYLIPFINAINKAWPELKKHVVSHFFSELDKFLESNFITSDMGWELRVHKKLFDMEDASHDYKKRLKSKKK